MITLDSLAKAALTYADVGATQGELPAGYHHLRQSIVIGTGRVDFARAASTVMTWGLQRGAGLHVEASTANLKVGTDALMTARLGPIRLSIPCRVVYVVDEPARGGFAYGTLPGHPECGEEAFIVSLLPDDRSVRLDIVAFSRPATLLAKLGRPVSRMVQRRFTDRYVEAVRQAVASQ